MTIQEKIESNLKRIDQPDQSLLQILLFRDFKTGKQLTKAEIDAALYKNEIWAIALCWFINLEYSSTLKIPWARKKFKPLKSKGQFLQAIYNAGLKIHASRKLLKTSYPKLLDEQEATHWIFLIFGELRHRELLDTPSAKMKENGKFQSPNLAAEKKKLLSQRKQSIRQLQGKEKWSHSAHPDAIANPLKRNEASLFFWFLELGCELAKKSDRFRNREWKGFIKAAEEESEAIRRLYGGMWAEGENLYGRKGRNGKIKLN